MRWIIASAIALFSPDAAAGHDLIMVANTTFGPADYGSVLFDAGSVQATGQQRDFWSYMFVRRGADYVRGANYTEVDCRIGRIRYLKRQMFDASHTEIGEMDRSTSWSRPPTDSSEERMVRLVCGTEKPTDAEKLGDLDPLTISDALLTNPKLR